MNKLNTHEDERLSALQRTGLLDTAPEVDFDEVATLAARLCETPISMVTLVDRDRQWFKAKVGLAIEQTSREASFCSHAIEGQEMFVVPNAEIDQRFHDNPLVTGDPKIRFYAGMPVGIPGGHALGTLCVIDVVPRELNVEQRDALAMLARQVSMLILMRNQMKSLQEILAEKQRVENQLRASEELFRAFMDNSPMVSYMKDREGRMVYYNRIFAERFQIAPKTWIGRSDAEIWPAELAESFRKTDVQVLEGKKPVVTEEVSPGPDGEQLYWRTYKFPFVDANGSHLLAGLSLDVSSEKQATQQMELLNRDLHEANRRLQMLSTTDALTGLYNRRAFNESLQKEFLDAELRGQSLSVLMIDVDNFKSINDRFGHDAGDRVLQYVAETLERTTGELHLVARYGGEEFSVVLPDTAQHDALLVAERLCARVAGGGADHHDVTLSVGIASATIGGADDARALIRRADQALYSAKRQGKNCVVAWQQAPPEASLH